MLEIETAPLIGPDPIMHSILLLLIPALLLKLALPTPPDTKSFIE